MKTMNFYKVGGATERNDKLIKVGKRHYCYIFGFFENEKDELKRFQFRKDYDHKPTLEELKADTNALINRLTDEAILNGFKWNNKPVYLSTENQMNFKAAYDLSVQTEGASLPIKFKLGESEDGKPVYHTFTTLSSFSDFYQKAVSYVIACINAGWVMKDSVDYESLLSDE